MKEKAEGVGLDEPGESRARMAEREIGRSSTGERSDERQECENVPVAHERLQQHCQHTETAPNQLWKDAINVYGARKHLTNSQPFDRDGFRRVCGIALDFRRRFGRRCGFVRPLWFDLVDHRLSGGGRAARDERRTNAIHSVTTATTPRI